MVAAIGGAVGYNFSQGGETAKGWIEHFWDYPFNRNADISAKDHPCQAYIIALGVNDRSKIAPGDASKDIDLADYTRNADTFAGYYGGIIQRVRSICPKAPIFVVTIPNKYPGLEFSAQIRAMADIFEDVSNVNINKDITITGGTIIGSESADPIFVIAPKSEGGPENVNISGVDFKVNNANVIVKATADNATSPTSIDVANINIEGNTIESANDAVVPESVTVLKLESERGILAPTGEISINGNTIEAGVNPFEFDVTTVTSGSDVNVPAGGDTPEKLATVIEYEDMNTTAIDSSIEPGTGKYFEITLRDSNGVALANKPVQFGFNGKIYNKTTDENGIAKLQINLQRSDIYTFAVSFQGDDAYNGSFAVAKITVKKQNPTLTVPNKSYKASAKTKTLTATFKSASGKVVANKKVTFTVNGKTYTATTNDKGVASVNVSLSTKKTYSFTAKFAGDNTYAAITKTAKLTIN